MVTFWNEWPKNIDLFHDILFFVCVCVYIYIFTFMHLADAFIQIYIYIYIYYLYFFLCGSLISLLLILEEYLASLIKAINAKQKYCA